MTTAVQVVNRFTLALFLLIGLGPERVEANSTIPDAALAQLDFRQVIKEAKDEVFPTVVFIKVVKESFERGKKISQEVSGSGVLISPEGQLLSNWHVVDKAVEVRCLLFDGRALEATVLGADKDTDLALLQLRLPSDAEPLPYARLGDSNALEEGDFVMAMGAPWGLTRSVSIGIISCTRRFLPQASEYSLWLQTDAAISPGNSGGPLVNTAGEVIGINTRGMMAGGDTGFAIPSAVIRDILEQFRKTGQVEWSWTGLQLQPLKDFNRNIYFDANEGVIVAETDPESPARRAGILAGDRLIRAGDKSVNALTEEDLPDLRRFFGLLPKEVPIEIELVRAGLPVTVELAPREKGRVEGEEHEFPRWDFTAKSINQFDNPDLFFHRSEGVFVYGIKFPGNAQAAGLMPRDILLRVDGQEVKTLSEVREIHKKALDRVQAKPRLVFTILRNGLMRQIVLDFSRDFEKN